METSDILTALLVVFWSYSLGVWRGRASGAREAVQAGRKFLRTAVAFLQAAIAKEDLNEVRREISRLASHLEVFPGGIDEFQKEKNKGQGP